MKKKYLNWILAMISAIILLLIILFVCVNIHNKKEAQRTRELEEKAIRSAFSVENASDILFVSVSNSAGDYVLMEDDAGRYMILGWEDEIEPQWNAETIKTFLNDILKLSVHYIANAVSPEKSTDYGFDDPSAEVMIVTTKEKLVFQLGDSTNLGNNYYALLEDGKVIAISGDAVNHFLGSVYGFADLYMYDEITSSRISDLHAVRFFKNGELNIEITQNGTENNGLYRSYGMIFPVDVPVDYSSMNEYVITPLQNMTFNRVVSENVGQSISEDCPYSLELDYGQETISLDFFGGDDSIVYCCRKNDGTIFELERKKTTFIQLEWNGFLDDRIYHRNINDISFISVDYPDGMAVIQIVGSGDDLHGISGYRDIYRNDLLNFYNLILSLPILSAIEDSGVITETPYLILRFALQDGTEEEISFYEASDRNMVVAYNGRPFCLTQQSRVKEVVNALMVMLDFSG